MGFGVGFGEEELGIGGRVSVPSLGVVGSGVGLACRRVVLAGGEETGGRRTFAMGGTWLRMWRLRLRLREEVEMGGLEVVVEKVVIEGLGRWCRCFCCCRKLEVKVKMEELLYVGGFCDSYHILVVLSGERRYRTLDMI